MLNHILKLAATTSVSCGDGLAPNGGTGCTVAGGFGGTNLFSLFSTVAQFLIFVAGAASIIMIIVGGLTMSLSAGDPSRVKTARATILYAVIGLVISLSALVIVNFVKGKLS